MAWEIQGEQPGPSSGNDLSRLADWRVPMQKSVEALAQQSFGDVTRSSGQAEGKNQGSIRTIAAEKAGAGVTHIGDKGGKATAPEMDASAPISPEVGQSELRPDQCRAFDIIIWHLDETLTGNDPPQLLMQIQGEGGMGKSCLIRAVTNVFSSRGAGELLTKSAYTGITASLIDRQTLHTIASIPQRPDAK